MTKDELQTKREELNGYLDELFMLWQIASDEQLPVPTHCTLMNTVSFKETQVNTVLQGLSGHFQKEFEVRRVKEYENRNANVGR